MIVVFALPPKLSFKIRVSLLSGKYHVVNSVVREKNNIVRKNFIIVVRKEKKTLPVAVGNVPTLLHQGRDHAAQGQQRLVDVPRFSFAVSGMRALQKSNRIENKS